jgi:hypothetical protein
MDLYLKHQTPDKGKACQQQDKRAAEMWERVLGKDKDLSKLTLNEWKTFTRSRKNGAIDARGHAVVPKKRWEVRQRTVGGDLEWLRRIDTRRSAKRVMM